MPPKADVVVIGGGIVGAACAYYLCAAGLDVHLVERSFPASGTSRACDGLILLWDKSGAEFEMGRASAALWAELAETLRDEPQDDALRDEPQDDALRDEPQDDALRDEPQDEALRAGPQDDALGLDFEYARTGTVLLAESEEGMASARERVAAMEAVGVRAEALDNVGLRSLEPNLAPDLAGGALFPDDAQVDPRRATLALLAAAQRQGLTLHTHAEVIAIRREENGRRRISQVITRTGEIATETVVCAAGVWSNQVARLVGIETPIRPRKGHILVTAKVPGLIHRPLLEGGYAATVQSASERLEVAFVAEMTASGTLLLGSSRQFVGYDRTVSLPVMRAIAVRAARFLPPLASSGVRVIRSYAGLRPWSPDHLPLIGPVEAVPGFYLAAGHEGAGIGLAPVTGRLIADWIAGIELPPFTGEVRPDRFELVG
jgi:glycine/D-amino acid oxidase-like deaminating enzyme